MHGIELPATAAGGETKQGKWTAVYNFWLICSICRQFEFQQIGFLHFNPIKALNIVFKEKDRSVCKLAEMESDQFVAIYFN